MTLVTRTGPVFSATYMERSKDGRKAIREAHLENGYTHVAMAVILADFARFDHMDDPDLVREHVREITGDGLGVSLQIGLEDMFNGRTNWKDHGEELRANNFSKFKDVGSNLLRELKPDLEGHGMVFIGVEFDEWCPWPAMRDIGVRFKNAVGPKVLVVPHFTTGTWGPPGTEAAWWRANKDWAGALSFQYDGKSDTRDPGGNGFRASESSIGSRTQQIKSRLPSGVSFIGGEYRYGGPGGATKAVEADAQHLGRHALASGASGVMNGA